MHKAAYGVGIESNFTFDTLPDLECVSHAARIEVERVSHIDIREGVWVGGGNIQKKYIQVYYHDTHLAYYIDENLAFELYPSEVRLVCQARPEISDEVLRYWILQQMLPFLLRLSELHEPLHGASVSSRPDFEPGSPCIAFLGQSYAGKSTLLSYVLSRNHTLVTDDLIALSPQNYREADPAIPYYRPYRAFEDLGIFTENYLPQRRPLERLYFLQPEAADSTARMSPVKPSEALARLMADKQYVIHHDRAPRFLHQLGARFQGIACAVREIPAFFLHIPRSMDRLPEVYDLIQEDLAKTS